ncbi:MAG: dienelactone hydrolase family protein [Acidimicrobiia bacterium]|nr:dienelactone hydrolase family protein [Acidimicrobiia bacterium]
MGEMVTFASNGRTTEGYLALPESGSGPGVVVIQEWWGLVPHIKDVCERFAAGGFVALAPDLFGGETVDNAHPDKAGELMMSLNVEQAAKDMVGAVDFLVSHDAVSTPSIGVTGFCMGGGLALWLAALRPDSVKAVVPFYGVLPWAAADPDYSNISAEVLGHYAGNDTFATPESVRELEAELRGHGVNADLMIYEGREHGFFNDTRADAHHPEDAAKAWARTLAFFREHLT